MKRIAASIVITPDGMEHYNYVVELEGGKVWDTYPLVDELPMTEWVSGTIRIMENMEITQC